MLKKISYKLLISYLAIILVVFLVFNGIFLSHYKEYSVAALETKLSEETYSLGRTLSYIIEDKASLEKEVKDFYQATGIRTTVIDKEGTVIAETSADINGMGNHMDRLEVIDAREKGIGIEIRKSSTLKEDFLYVARPIYIEGKIDGYIRLSVTLSSAQEIPEKVNNMLKIAILMAFMVATIISAYFSRTISRPIRELTNATTEIKNANFDIRVYPKTTDEISILAKAVNSMADTLKSNIDKILLARKEVEVILDNLNNAVLLLDEKGKVKSMNRHAREIFGIFDFSKKDLHNLQVVRDYHFDKVFQESWKEKKVITTELSLFLPDLKILQAVLIPIEEDYNYILASFHDITEIKRAEKIRTEFVANASHELKTPLTSIKGFTETLLDGAMEDPEVTKKFLTIIDAEAERLSRLAEDMLSLAKIESRNVALKINAVDMQAIAEKICQRYAKFAQEKNIRLENQVSEDLPLVAGDEDWLTQVILNLVENAVKYIGDGDHVKIHSDILDGNVYIAVSDNGMGIPEEDLDRVFERFYRVDKARSSDSGGTGLGLSIVKHVIESHRGKIGIRSKVYEGTTVWFTLPVYKREEK